jgi:hypothetical protein
VGLSVPPPIRNSRTGELSESSADIPESECKKYLTVFAKRDIFPILVMHNLSPADRPTYRTESTAVKCYFLSFNAVMCNLTVPGQQGS